MEIRRLQEKYEDPEIKKGKPRSHVGNLQYCIVTVNGVEKRVLMNSNTLN
jgi:hypothetical protein